MLDTVLILLTVTGMIRVSPGHSVAEPTVVTTGPLGATFNSAISVVVESPQVFSVKIHLNL